MIKTRLIFGAIATIATLCAASPVHARITDAAGDLLSTFTGGNRPDLDVLSADVFFDGTNFTLTTTLAGAIDTSLNSNAIYVWGFDRGNPHPATAPFAGIGIDNVFFDSVITVRPDTTVTVNRTAGNGAGTTQLGVGTATVNGSTISTKISADLLPTNGFAPGTYTWNLWPRINSTVGGTANISDFAPNNSNLGVTVVPESGSAVLFAPALIAGLGMIVLRRRNATSA